MALFLSEFVVWLWVGQETVRSAIFSSPRIRPICWQVPRKCYRRTEQLTRLLLFLWLFAGQSGSSAKRQRTGPVFCTPWCSVSKGTIVEHEFLPSFWQNDSGAYRLYVAAFERGAFRVLPFFSRVSKLSFLDLEKSDCRACRLVFFQLQKWCHRNR